jgi:D-alanine-D-alanine ligase
MEANLVPGMTYGSSYFPEACNIADEFAYDKVIELLLAGGLARASSNTPPHLHPGSDNNLVAVT